MKKINLQKVDPKLLLLPKINEFLLKSSDKKFSPEALEMVWNALATPGRDRSSSFSASSAGGDLRHQELAFLGYPQTQVILPNLQVIFTIGHWLHAMTQAMLLTGNLIQDIEVPVENDEYYAKGSMDGQGYVWWEPANPKWAGQEFLLEAKTVGAHQWMKKAQLGRPSDNHLAQIHRYFLLTGIRLCSYIMIDKGGQSVDGIKEFVVEADDKLLAASQKELEELKHAVDTKTLHPASPSCRIGLKGCPYGGPKGYCGTVHEWITYEQYLTQQ